MKMKVKTEVRMRIPDDEICSNDFIISFFRKFSTLLIIFDVCMMEFRMMKFFGTIASFQFSLN